MKSTRITTPLVLVALALTSGSLLAEEASTVAGPNGTKVVISGNEGARTFQARWGYAPAIRAGDLVVLSGVIAGGAGGTDVAAFERGLRLTFASLRDSLAAADASFEDVIRINSYHVWDSEHFEGDKLAHMEAVRTVKAEFFGDATPTWTAIGVNGLFSDQGLVEIELTAHAPATD